MNLCKELPNCRYSACAISIWLCMGWSLPSHAACTLTPSPGNDNFVCDSGNSGPLTDLAGNNTLTFPTNGTGTITGNVTFGGGNDALGMNSGIISGRVNQGDGADTFSISAGQVAGAVNQGNGVDTFVMSGGTIQSLAQGDSRDFFEMSAGTITGAFEDGDTARMTGGSIGRVDMKLDNNLFDLSGGQILGNLVTGFGTDTIIVSGGRIGGNISVSGGNDSITVTGGEIVGEIRASVGNDTLTWDGGGIIRSAILMEDGNDRATLRNLNDSILAQTPLLNGGNGSDLLTFDNTTTHGAARYANWETVNLGNGSRLDLDGNFVLGDSSTGSGVFNIDGSSVVTSTQGSLTPFTAGQRATLNNAGVIDLSSGNTRTSDTLTVQGNYAGSGGQLRVQSALGDDSSPSDRLVVNDGTLTGTPRLSSTIWGARARQPCKTAFRLSRPRARPSATVAPSHSRRRYRPGLSITTCSRVASLSAAKTAGTCVRPSLRLRWWPQRYPIRSLFQIPIPTQHYRPCWCRWYHYRWQLSAPRLCRRPWLAPHPFPCTARKSRSGRCCHRRPRNWP